MEKHKSRLGPRVYLAVRNITIALICFALVTGLVQLFHNGKVPRVIQHIHGHEPVTSSSPPFTDIGSSKQPKSGNVDYKLRPDSLVVANDAFLGQRPHVDIIANYSRLIEKCTGATREKEWMHYGQRCLDYLADNQDDYYFVPKGVPSAVKSGEKYRPAAKGSIGTCSGPIVPFHVYWRGPATWRVELFAKAYLLTQNLACSRLYLWLDTDSHPNAIPDMRVDPIFKKFLPLLDRGDITLKEWKIPTRIELAKSDLSKDITPTDSDINLGDNVIMDKDGKEWLILSEDKMTFLPVAVSDAARFIILHQYGGVYCDMDILLIRDMRPLLIAPNHNFAERWSINDTPWDYNTAVMSLEANSALSSFLLRGGVRMNFNFHPWIIGRLAHKEGVADQLTMFETALFDPIWGVFDRGNKGGCVYNSHWNGCLRPNFRDFGMAFLGEQHAIQDEWSAYGGAPQVVMDGGVSGAAAGRARGAGGKIPTTDGFGKTLESMNKYGVNKRGVHRIIDDDNDSNKDNGRGKGTPSSYNINEDRYPPNNRTMEYFFRGAYSYHIHNQWSKHPQPNSWLSVVMKTQDSFLAGLRVNPYGERWDGPFISAFDRFKEFD